MRKKLVRASRQELASIKPLCFPLITPRVPLDAQTIDETKLEDGNNPDSAFGSDTILETIDSKVIGKPMTLEQLDAATDKVLDGKDPHTFTIDQIAEIDEILPKTIEALEKGRPKLEEKQKAAKTEKQKHSAADAIKRLDEKVANVRNRTDELKNLVHNLRPGSSVIVQVRKDGETVDNVYGITLGVDLSKIKGNLGALSRVGTRIALASPARELRVPGTRFLGSDASYDLLNANDGTVRRAFENGQAEARETRQIVTGNIIGGLKRFSKGQIVIFTREDGSQDNGILLPKDFNAKKALEDSPVDFHNLDHAIEFVMTAGTAYAPALLKTSDGTFTAQREEGGGIKLAIKRRGGKPYILSPAARELVGDFSARSGDFKKTIDTDRFRSLIEVYRDTLGAQYIADAHKDEACAITGEQLPDFDGGDAEMRGDAPVYIDPAPYGDVVGINELRQAAFNFYRGNIAGHEVVNAATGWNIKFAGTKAAKKVSRKGKGDTILRAISELPTILQSARVVSSDTDNRGRAEVKLIHALEAEISLDGAKPVKVRAYVREMHNGRFFYDLTGNVSAGRSVPPKGTFESEMTPALEGSADQLKLVQVPEKINAAPDGWGETEGDTSPTPANFRAVTKAVKDEITASGLSGKVKAKVSFPSRTTADHLSRAFLASESETSGNDPNPISRHLPLRLYLNTHFPPPCAPINRSPPPSFSFCPGLAFLTCIAVSFLIPANSPPSVPQLVPQLGAASILHTATLHAANHLQGAIKKG